MSLPNHLHHLTNFGLIEAALALADTYRFRHVLVQEAAYASLLRADRVAVHRAVGQALETLPGTLVTDQAAVLGHHFERGGDEARALHYFTEAGDHAFQRYANAEAIAAYDHALTLAERLPTPPATWLHLYSQRGRALELSTHYTEALANYIAMEARGQAVQDEALLFDALLAQATLYSTFTPVYDATLSLQLTARALELARTLNDPRAETRALWMRMSALAYGGVSEEAIALGEQAIALARTHHFRTELAFTLNDITWNYLEIKRLPAALAAAREANTLWRELGNLPMLADNLINLTVLSNFLNDFENQWASAHEAFAISQAIGNVVGQCRARGTLARLHFERGEVATALAHVQAAKQLAQAHALTPFLVMNCLGLMQLYFDVGAYAASQGEFAQIQALLAQASASTAYLQHSVPLWEARLLLATGAPAAAAPLVQTLITQFTGTLLPEEPDYYLWIGVRFEWLWAQADFAAAYAWMSEVLRAAQPQAWSTAWCWLAQGRAAWQLGWVAEAEASLRQALALLPLPHRHFWRWQALAHLSVVEAAGHPPAAALHRAEAQQLFEAVLAQLPAEFHAGFRALPAAQLLRPA